jgi:hypothetical protein
VNSDRILRYNNRSYLPPYDELRFFFILYETHRAVYMAHPGVMKMMTDLKPLFYGRDEV